MKRKALYIGILLLVSMLAVALLALTGIGGVTGLLLWLGAGLLITATAIVGRALFYVLVIPTTMPGAFFWRNAGFQSHACETGLADMPQVGVVPEAH